MSDDLMDRIGKEVERQIEIECARGNPPLSRKANMADQLDAKFAYLQPMSEVECTDTCKVFCRCVKCGARQLVLETKTLGSLGPIPVTERLPEDGEIVLAFDSHIRRWHDAEFCDTENTWYIPGCSTRLDVTHWLPQPPAPE